MGENLTLKSDDDKLKNIEFFDLSQMNEEARNQR